MEEKFCFNNLKSVHLVGIGGISMSAIAKALLKKGLKVSGSDKALSEQTKELAKQGATIFIGHKGIYASSCDAVVYSSAISPKNPEIKRAKKRNVPIIKRSEMLAHLLRDVKRVIAVSGSHGKTTTTAMLAQVFIDAKKDPTVYLGGEHKDFGNFREGKGECAIIEACEYKKNFLDIKPSISVVLNIDNDHFDSYENMSDMQNTFCEFIGKNIAVVNVDDKYSSKISNQSTITFGIKNQATVMAKGIKFNGERYSFSLYLYGEKIGRINLKLAGKHSVYNALSVCVVALNCGVSFKQIKATLEKFTGVKRRNEQIGKMLNKCAICDYAHHPSEIMATLQAYKNELENVLVVFQPHTYSRTKLLFDDFLKVLKTCKNLIIYKTYPAREKFNKEGSAKRLYLTINKHNNNIQYCCDRYNLYKKIKKITDENQINKILFLGAGDIYDIAKELCDKG